MTELKDLQDGMKRITTDVCTVVEKGDVREIRSRFKDETYRIADAVIADETGSIKLTLWNEEIDKIHVGDKVRVESGYVTAFKGDIQLNVGKFGKMIVS